MLMRIDAHDDYLEGGLTIEDVIAFCKLAKEAGVDVLDISRGNIITAGLKFEVPPIDLERGFNMKMHPGSGKKRECLLLAWVG